MKRFGEIFEAVSKRTRTRCYCETCGKVFLDISTARFIKESCANTEYLTDRWVVMAVEHKYFNPDHRIMEQTGPLSYESEGVIDQAQKSSLKDIEKFKEYVETEMRPF